MPLLDPMLLILVPLIHILGVLGAIDAIFSTRTPQGAVAWMISLVTFPYLAVPLYAIFGRRKFTGYVEARRSEDLELHHITRELQSEARSMKVRLPPPLDRFAILENMAALPFTDGNTLELLINGEQTFDHILASIQEARLYILIQFYTFRADQIGVQLKDALIEKSNQGVPIYFLYDEIGCYKLPTSYLEDLRQSGVKVSAFGSNRGAFTNKFQINFRNHRKIVVVDGKTGFVGGHNVGDEYLGRNPRFSPWRDTHLRIEGPALQGIQLSFAEDWYWACKDVPDMYWQSTRTEGNSKVLVFPTGPADTLETCTLLFTHLIHSAKKRLWLVSPYFAPDSQIISAIHLAALRGVDVRILLPSKPDHYLIFMASFSYLEQMDLPNIHLFRYEPGFLHQKVVLVDDDLAMVGTANADNRSFRLNFEISILAADPKFARQVEDMLKEDFSKSKPTTGHDYRRRNVLFRLAVRCSRLTAPVL
jgi:cardiolipin synthase